MRTLLLALLAAGCATSAPDVSGKPVTSKTFVARNFRVHALYRGTNWPLKDVARLMVLTPSDNAVGIAMVGRVTCRESGADYRPNLEETVLELEPGLYRLELWYWIGRSRFEEAGGKRGLNLRSLRSAKVAVMEAVLEAGRLYYIDPELRFQDAVPADQRDAYYPLLYSSTLAIGARPEKPERELAEWIWRPHLKTWDDEAAAHYDNYR